MVLARTVVRRMRALFQPPTDDHAISALQAFGWHALTGTNDVAADGGLCANRPVVADERTSSTPELRPRPSSVPA
jgi:hypothetical protein